MHRFAICLAFSACATAFADDAKPSVTVALIDLKMELEKEASAMLGSGMRFTDRAAYRKQLDEFYARTTPFCRKALRLAEENSRDPGAYDALAWIVTGPFAYTRQCGPIIDRAYEILCERYLADARNGPLCKNIGRFGVSSTLPKQFLNGVIERNPTRAIRGLACLKLGDLLLEQAKHARLLQDPAAVNGLEWRDSISDDMREYLMKTVPEEFEKQAERTFQRAVKEFAEVNAYSDQTVSEIARGRLFRLSELVVGKPAPKLDGSDLRKEPIKLNDFRGKVILLAFWAGWSPTSTQFTAQATNLAGKYEGKPFALVGINGDDTRAAAERVVEQQRLSWRSLFDGNGGRGPIATQWGIVTWPTIFVIDADGIIRHVAYDSAKLEEIIDGLISKKK
jgi:peroxiredoxin